MRKIFFAVLLVPAIAWAAPTTAADWFKEGAKDYNLGNFDEAVEAFKKAFELETDENKRAAYLYNIAQSYRQANDCVKAQFFYKRFISLRSQNTVKPLTAEERKPAEDFIRDLEPCARQAKALSDRPPDTLDTSGQGSDKPPEASAGRRDPQVAVAPPPKDTGGEDEPESPAPEAEPHVISARLIAGGAKITMSKAIPVPVQATFALIAGYPIAISDKLTIDVGGAFTFTPVPYELSETPMMPRRTKTAQMYSALANVGVAYEVFPRFALRGDIGFGALFFSNVSMSRFTDDQPATGALSMLHVRAAASADYAITPNFIVTAMPIAFSYSPPKDGLAESIDAITSINFMVGIGYRM